ncbi:MAG: hypothetical protein IK016_02545 [Lachnospiraceae bacterium]|nr:hypothetical protein [Lachnospiraceae bacterium]
MRTLVLQLFNRKNRPTFLYVSNEEEITALFDSGAETPVWCAGERDFVAAYPDAKRLNWKTKIFGFGKDAEMAAVYVIPDFRLADGNEVYRIRNLQVAVCYHPLIGCDFVMSDTMFSKADTYIHRIGQRQIEVFFEKDQYLCAVKKGAGTFSVVTFSQEERGEE